MSLFDQPGSKKVVIGMVHLGALPGTPYFEEGSYEAIAEKAVADARALEAGGADGCVVQNRGDRVFARDRVDPAVTVAMADIVRAVRRATGPDFRIGVQILRNDLEASLAVAHICGGAFLRCGALAGAAVTPSGLLEADPYTFQNYRRHLGATQIELIAEIYSMHFKWLDGRPIAEAALNAQFSGADAVALGDPDEAVTLDLVRHIKAASPDLPVILSAHTNHENAARLLAEADGAIVGSCFEGGDRGGYVQAGAVREYVDILSRL